MIEMKKKNLKVKFMFLFSENAYSYTNSKKNFFFLIYLLDNYF